MIQRFKDRALPYFGFSIADSGLTANPEYERQQTYPVGEQTPGGYSKSGEDEFEFLLRHALSTTAAEPDGGKVWQHLARKMRGPFGAPALEGPGCTTLEQALMSSGGRVQLAPFVLGSPWNHEEPAMPGGTESLWARLRCFSVATAPKGYSWMFT
jgi:hypothetical protein